MDGRTRRPTQKNAPAHNFLRIKPESLFPYTSFSLSLSLSLCLYIYIYLPLTPSLHAVPLLTVEVGDVLLSSLLATLLIELFLLEELLDSRVLAAPNECTFPERRLFLLPKQQYWKKLMRMYKPVVQLRVKITKPRYASVEDFEERRRRCA